MPDHERVAMKIGKELGLDTIAASWVLAVLSREYGDARRDALEEAAKMVDEFADRQFGDGATIKRKTLALAASIRAAKEEPRE
jgi:hypothetical protein